MVTELPTTSGASNRSFKVPAGWNYDPKQQFPQNTIPAGTSRSGIGTGQAAQLAYNKSKDLFPVVTASGQNVYIQQFSKASALPVDQYAWVSKKITLRNPNTGLIETFNGYYVRKDAEKTRKTSGGTGGRNNGGGDSGGGSNLPQANPSEWDWNLPPHRWSLPVVGSTVDKEGYSNVEEVKEKSNVFYSQKGKSKDTYRRGRIWWKASSDIQTIDRKGNLTKQSNNGRQYGFQFLWNPESFGTQVSVNWDITPSAADRFVSVAGVFPATETITFNVRIDRTNDFACASAALPRPSQVGRGGDFNKKYSYLNGIDLTQFVQYYKGTSAWAADESTLVRKIRDLLERGTLADIEFLYRAINGKGPSGNDEWVNGRGIPTADIGYLMPTLLHIDIGPLSYDGNVQSLSVNHLAFTPDMIPIRSDVTISCNLLATVGLASKDGRTK